MNKKPATPTPCVYPACLNTARTRGLCHAHYQTMRDRVRKGRATETDLQRRGLLLPKGTGGSPVTDHSAFELGSKVRGKIGWTCPVCASMALADEGDHHLCEKCDKWYHGNIEINGAP